MSISSRSYARPFISGSGLPPGIKALLITNCAVFLVQFFGRSVLAGFLAYFELVPYAVVRSFHIWQLVTYMFMHGGILHLVFNMFGLWMFGRELEELWGTREFLRFYFICGILAGVCVVIVDYFFGNPVTPTIGASGAIYGVLAASAALWPDREILFSFLFPVKMKYFVLIIAAITYFESSGVNSGVSNVAHLSGLVFGYALVKMPQGRKRRGPRVSVTGSLQDAYKNWKLQRAKKKFQVYLKKQGRGPWVN